MVPPKRKRAAAVAAAAFSFVPEDWIIGSVSPITRQRAVGLQIEAGTA